MRNCQKQFYAFQLTIGTNELPLSVDEVKAHLKIISNSEDIYLKLLIESVVEFFETFTNRILINKTYTGYLDSFECSYYNCNYYNCYNSLGCCCDYWNEGILIKKSKVHTINSIKYLVDGVLTTWNSTNYYLTTENLYPSINLTEDGEYPDDVDEVKQAIEIEFKAGYGDTKCDIPADIKLGMLNHIAFLYENRGDCPDANSCEVPCAVRTIYKKYKIPNLIGGC